MGMAKDARFTKGKNILKKNLVFLVALIVALLSHAASAGGRHSPNACISTT